MSVALGPINSGLPKDIVSKIIEKEKIPLKKMEIRKEKVAEVQKLVEELGGLMDKARTEVFKNDTGQDFRELKVLYNDDIIDVEIDKSKAMPGNYQFESVKMAQKSSAMTTGFADPDKSYIGVGFIQYTLPDGEVRDIYIDSDNASLNGVAKLINEDSSSGMRATVINDGSDKKAPWRIVLALDKTGDANLADFPYFYFVDGEDDFELDFERNAHDASIKLDGFSFEKPTNSFSDVIPGLTLNLKKAAPGQEFTIRITEDVSVVTEKIDALVKSINDILKFINTQNDLDENSDTTRTLGGNILLQTIESRLRDIIFKNIMTPGGSLRIGDFGVTFQKNGQLNFDQKLFSSKVSQNFENATRFFIGYFDQNSVKQPGFMDQLKNFIDGTLAVPNGIISTQKKGLMSKTQQLNKQIEQRQRIIDKKEESLKGQFARLEGTVAQMQSQSTGLAALSQSAGLVSQES